MSPIEERTRFGGIGEAFADRNFRVYSIGSIGSWISYFVQKVTVGWLTWELTGSTQWLAVMALLDIIPNVVLMPFAGPLADRYDRHWIIISFMVPAMYGTVPRFVARERVAWAIAVSSSYTQ